MDYDLGLEKYAVEIDMGAKNETEFMCFLEVWELDAIKRQSAANEFRQLQKYKNVNFFDAEDGAEGTVYKIIETNVEWKKKDRHDKETPCYCILAKPAADDADNDTNLESFHINDELLAMIRHPQAGHPENFQLKFSE